MIALQNFGKSNPVVTNPSAPGDQEFLITSYIELWKKVIEVQQHFNEIAMRIRNAAFSVFGAFLVFSGYIFKESISVKIWSHNVPLPSIILFLAIFPLGGFFFMDRFWYHRLLVGSVNEAKKIEHELDNLGINIKLTTNIEIESHDKLFYIFSMRARSKLTIFYLGGIIILLVLASIVYYEGSFPSSSTNCCTTVLSASPLSPRSFIVWDRRSISSLAVPPGNRAASRLRASTGPRSL